MHILYSCSSYRLFRGLHLSVSPVCILGLVSCVYCPFIAQIMIVTLHNRAPQAGTDVKACMTAHLHRIHTCYAPRCCPHSQACSLSSLSAVIIHLKPPPLVHTAHLPPSLHNLASSWKRGDLNCFSLGVSSTKSSVARVQWQWRSKCGQVQRNNNTLPTMSPLFREKLQQSGCRGTTVYMDCKDAFTLESLGN